MAINTIAHGGYRWVAIDKVDEEAIEFLRTNFRFHNLDLEDVRGAVQHSKLDVYKHYFFLVAHFPEGTNSGMRLRANEIDIFVERKTIVTIPNREVPYLQNLITRLERNPKARGDFFKNGTAFLCYRILKGIYTFSFNPLLDHIALQVHDMEERLNAPNSKRFLLDLTAIRRDILDLRRMVEPQRFVMRDLAALNTDFADHEMAPYFDDLRDLLDRIWSLTDSYREVVASLAATKDSLISNRTTEIIRVLTVISVSFLPLTLLTGIYGMNLSNLPLADHPTTVWFLFAFIAGFLVLILAILKKIRWL